MLQLLLWFLLFLFFSGRSTRAYKVAGFTLLGCVLIMGQGMIVYFLYSQKSDIKSLQEQSHKLNTEMTNQRSGEVHFMLGRNEAETIPRAKEAADEY